MNENPLYSLTRQNREDILNSEIVIKPILEQMVEDVVRAGKIPYLAETKHDKEMTAFREKTKKEGEKYKAKLLKRWGWTEADLYDAK